MQKWAYVVYHCSVGSKLRQQCSVQVEMLVMCWWNNFRYHEFVKSQEATYCAYDHLNYLQFGEHPTPKMLFTSDSI
jgi:hypothetical protein